MTAVRTTIFRSRRRRLTSVATVAVLLSGGCADTRSVAFEELDAMRVQGLAYLEEERPAEATERFTRLTRLAPREPLGPANLAVAQLRAGNLEAAEQAATRAVRRSPADPDVRLIAAAILAEQEDPAAAETHLHAALATDSAHVPALWALHRLTADPDPLERLLRHSPGNLAARLAAAEMRAEAGETDAALAHLEYVEQLLPPGASEVREELVSAHRAANRDDAEQTLRQVRIVHNLLRVDQLYTRGLSELTGRPGSRAEPLRRFRRTDGGTIPEPEGPLDLSYVRVGSLRGWSGGVATDFDGDGDTDLVVADGREVRCLVNEVGRLNEWACAPAAGGDRLPVQAADFDGDGRADLLMAGPGGVDILYAESEGFASRGELPAGGNIAYTAVAADVDHDGDLDILVGGPGATRLYRQGSPGRFEEVGEQAGLAAVRDVRAATFGDLDLDGDLDLVLAAERGVQTITNQRHGTFRATGEARLPAGRPEIAEVTGDGRLDLVVGTADGIFVATGDTTGSLSPLRRASASPGATADTATSGGDVAAGTTGPAFPGMIIEDLDLDGRVDVMLVRQAGPLRVYRGIGDGRFLESADVVEDDQALPDTMTGAAVAFDLDRDGDFDLAVGGETGGTLFRNEGGERNHALEVRLLALADGSGKVNRLGIGSRLDVWAGSLHQSRVVRSELETFGLGERARADVVRIEWTNGVPQNVFDPQASERLVETQVLKGSCAFLYTWTGERFEFVTDMMWKSALGMPLGIMASEVAYASPDPSLEYVRIPAGMLAERDGGYELRITEELWEVAYLDALTLRAVDHPVDVELYVDEAFGEPTVANERMYTAGDARAPEVAIDHRGMDVRRVLAKRDFTFVGGFERGPYQGVTKLHDLTLTLTGAAGLPARLFLGGWVHPTDASINLRMAQGGASSVIRPRVEVPDGSGGWRRISADFDFPSGKNKTVVLELPEGLPPEDPRLRIRTNMEIYWDVAFYSTEPLPTGLVHHRLRPAEAELRERGFSRLFRRGGRYGPHWFDYAHVSAVSPWRPLPGAYTRTGDVRELLLTPDDRYVVLGPGDEIAVRFEAPAPPPGGWKRTFFLFSDGFLKDADLNTRGGDRVGPLPWHGQTSYPPSPPARVDSADVYLTRVVESGRPPSRPQF